VTENSPAWRGTYAQRFNERVAIQRPAPAPVYRRLTDDQIALLPEPMRPLAALCRSFSDQMQVSVARFVHAQAARPLVDLTKPSTEEDR
jgi:hypothetical protein